MTNIMDVIDRHIPRPSEETIPLLDALGRVSARSLIARRPMPPFDVSALDGYAVRGAGTDFRTRGSLEPLGETPLPLKEGEAVFVPTGGRFPRGSRFAAREHVAEKADAIRVETEADERKVVTRGDWLKKGRRLIDRGDVIGPAAMGLLALGGHEALRVFRKPAVALIATGSELKKEGGTDSNKFLLAGLVQRDGGSIAGLHTVDDDEEEIRRAMRESPGARLFILTGGTAKGKKDLTKQAVRRMRFRFLLDSPPIQPGKTMAFGRKGPQLFFILPGNPKAVESLYELFVKRALLGMAGRPFQEESKAAEGMRIPILSFVGRSGTGKTTVIERLIPHLTARGIRVATLKHHPHDFEMDREGKDSYRHKRAGAALAMVVSPGKVALVEDVDGEPGLAELVSRHVHDVDLVITEGFKREDVPRIEVYNVRNQEPPVSLGHRSLLALVTDMPMDAPVPVLHRDDIGRLAEFIVEKVMSGRTDGRKSKGAPPWTPPSTSKKRNS